MRTFFQKHARKFIQAGSILAAIICLIAVSVASYHLYAATANRNKPISYEGRLFNNNFQPVADGNYTMSFAIYDAVSGGSCLWATGSNESSGSANCSGVGTVSVSVNRGLFHVQLGDDSNSVTNMAPMDLDFNSSNYFLQVTVSGETLSPRSRIGAAGYVYNADEFDALNSTQYLRSDIDDTDIGLLTLTSVPTGTTVGLGSAYLNPTNNGGTDTNTLLGLAVNNTLVDRLDMAGNLSVGGILTVAGGGSNSANNSIIGNLKWTNDNQSDIGSPHSALSGASYYWTGDNTTADAIGGNNGTLLNGATYTSGKFGQAFTFDGVDDKVVIANPISSPANGTVSVWVNSSGNYTNTQAVMTGGDAPGLTIHARLEIFAHVTGICPSGDWGTVLTDGVTSQFACSGDVYNSTNFPAGTWEHVAFTYDGSNIRFYKNGALINTVVQTVSNVGDAQTYNIGGAPCDCAFYSGSIDDAQIYPRTLSASEVNTLYTMFQAPRTGYFNSGVEVGNGTTSDWNTGTLVGNGAFTLSSTSSNLTLNTVTSGNLILNPVDNVGVGLSSPTSKLHIRAGSGESPFAVEDASSNPFLYVDSSGLVGVRTNTPTTRLNIAGLTINTDADNTIAAMQTTASFTKNDTATKTFSVSKLVPTFNFGVSNTNTSVNVLDIDTINTSTTGLTVNLIHGASGGVEKIKIDSSGSVSLAGNVLPLADNAQDVGTDTTRFGSLGLSGADTAGMSIHADNTNDQKVRSYFTSGNVARIESVGATVPDLRFTAGTGTLYIDDSGSVGINTSTPTAGTALHINGNLRVTGTTTLNGVAYTWPSSDGGSGYQLSTNGSGTLSWIPGFTNNWSQSGNIVYLASATDNVGIGTSSPTSKLTVDGGGISIAGTLQQFNWQPRVPKGNTTTSIAGSGVYGGTTAIAISSAGNPLVAYTTSTTAMNVASCADINCTSSTIHTIDSTNSSYSGQGTSMVIGTDGYPVVVYTVSPGDDVYLAKCSSIDCSGSASLVKVFDGGGAGNYSMGRVAIGTDGFPVVAIQTANGYDAKLVKCGNASCSSISSTNNIDTASFVTDIDVTMTPDGFPLVVYSTGTGVKAVKCSTASCSSLGTITTVDSVATSSAYPSVAIGSDGIPVMAYLDNITTDFKITKCSASDCTGSATITTIESSGNIGYAVSLSINPIDGFPIAIYTDSSGTNVHYVKCGNNSCSTNAIYSSISKGALTSYDEQITSGPDGLPIFTYTGSSSISIAHCGNQYCLPYWTQR